jgi:hypothetical protein
LETFHANEFYGGNGASPRAGGIFDAAGSLSGTTYAGGSNDDGVVFELMPPESGQTIWSYSSLFTSQGSVLNAGTLFGAASTGGVIKASGTAEGTIIEIPPQ